MEVRFSKWFYRVLKKVLWTFSYLFYRHLPTSDRQNTVKTAPQPLIVDKAFFALYVGIILPIGPTPISLFVFDLEAED